MWGYGPDPAAGFSKPQAYGHAVRYAVELGRLLGDRTIRSLGLSEDELLLDGDASSPNYSIIGTTARKSSAIDFYSSAAPNKSFSADP